MNFTFKWDLIVFMVVHPERRQSIILFRLALTTIKDRFIHNEEAEEIKRMLIEAAKNGACKSFTVKHFKRQ